MSSALDSKTDKDTTDKATLDKAGREYWDDCWAGDDLPEALDVHAPNFGRTGDLKHYVERRFHEKFHAVLDKVPTRGRKFLEIGCAQSVWLPYFAREFGFEVCGLDYSPGGCEQEGAMLAREGIAGEVVCADLFAPPAPLLDNFDVLLSLGVVEHFADTAACLQAMSRFLKPGGLMLTAIPNLSGAIGTLQKHLNRPVYDIHVPLDAAALSRAHRRAGMEVVQCHYFLSTNFGVNNLNGLPTGSPSWLLKKTLLGTLTRFSRAVWLAEDKTRPFRSRRLSAPYIFCVARKAGGQ